MELIIIVLALAALGPLAARFGYDSRAVYRSHEHQLASRGVTWSELEHQQQLALETNVARAERSLPNPRVATESRPYPATA